MLESSHVTPRKTMDPESTLPSVALVSDPSAPVGRGTLRQGKKLIMHGDIPIGKATIVEDTVRKEAWFCGVNIISELRGSGYGLSTYLAAIEHAHANGETFRTHDWSQTEAAAKVWNRFIAKGVAEVVEPFVLISGGAADGKYTGHAEIRPTAQSI